MRTAAKRGARSDARDDERDGVEIETKTIKDEGVVEEGMAVAGIDEVVVRVEKGVSVQTTIVVNT